MKSTVTTVDLDYMERAIELARNAEFEGNLPIAALAVLNGRIIAEAGNKVLRPEFHPGRHAEIEVLNQISGEELHEYSRSIVLYTTHEPCIMCLGAIIVYRIGKVVFGGRDPSRGSSYLLKDLEKIYTTSCMPEIVGPVLPDTCDEMFLRAEKVYRAFRDRRPG